MRSTAKHIRLDQRGATAIEYAMIAFFVSIAGFAAIQTIGTDVSAVFTTIASSF